MTFFAAKTQHPIILPLLTVLLIVFILGCEPKDPVTPPTFDFSCIQRYNSTGEDDGLYGDCTSTKDWGRIPLTNDEYNAYLSTSDTVSLTGTNATGITQMALFPNPVVRTGAAGFAFLSAVSDLPFKAKIAIIDQSGTVLDTYALQMKTNQVAQFLIAGNKYQSGQYYRIYYLVSTENNAVEFEGHGNILVCKEAIEQGLNTIEGSCI